MLHSPIAVLYDDDGNAMALSQSAPLSAATSGYMMVGSGSSGGGAALVKVAPTGEVFITGSIDAIAAGVQQVTGSVYVDNMPTTGANGGITVNQGTSGSYADAWKVVLTDASGSIFGTQASPLWVTGAMTVTGSVAIVGTVNTREINSPNAATTQIAASLSVQTALVANANRRGAVFYKTGNGNAYVKLGTGATASDYTTIMVNNAYWEVPANYTGIITVIFDKLLGGIKVTEITE